MTDEASRQTRRKRPLVAETKRADPWDLLTALKHSVDLVVENGEEAVRTMTDRIEAQEGSTRWTKVLAVVAVVAAVLALVVGIIAITASTKANDAQETARRLDAEQVRLQAQGDHDRCISGNDLRAATADLNRGNVAYIDTLLEVFGTFAPPTSSLTPEQQEQQAVITKKLADARRAQLDKTKDPALEAKDCDKLYPVPS